MEYKSTIISNGSLISPEIISKMVREWKTYKRMVEHREENSGDDSAC